MIDHIKKNINSDNYFDIIKRIFNVLLKSFQ